MSATLGGASSVIITSGDISAQAFSLNDADASTSSVTGGALNLNFFAATASMDSDRDDARHRRGQDHQRRRHHDRRDEQRGPAAGVRRQFNAATDVSNGVEHDHVQPHPQRLHGQLVVYDRQGGTEIATEPPWPQHQRHRRSDPKSLQLGMSFGFDNPATRTSTSRRVRRPGHGHHRLRQPVAPLRDRRHRRLPAERRRDRRAPGRLVQGLQDRRVQAEAPVAVRRRHESADADHRRPRRRPARPPDQRVVLQRPVRHLPRAATNVWSFTRDFVDVTDCSPLPCAGSNNDVIYIGRDRTGDGDADDHNLSDGNTVFYSSSDAIGGLSNGVDYYVIRVDGLNIKLATNYCRASASRSAQRRAARAARRPVSAATTGAGGAGSRHRDRARSEPERCTGSRTRSPTRRTSRSAVSTTATATTSSAPTAAPSSCRGASAAGRS